MLPQDSVKHVLFKDLLLELSVRKTGVSTDYRNT